MRIYNTLMKKEEEFKPLKGNKVGIYFCGMTVQDSPHIGHLRAFLSGDILRRYLEYRGFEVTYILNFTDIDDKIIKKSWEEGVDWREIAQRYEKEYFEVEKSMNIKPASFYPRATQHIEEILNLVLKLEEKKFAYNVEGNVWYDVSKFKHYGKLSGKSIDELVEGARIEPDPTKKDPLDFSLWKKAKKKEPYFYSPFGKGRPGWHIECSAMSMKYLGETVDIHGGGQDLIFPHHENEIAQSEAATGKPFVRYWFHNGPVNLRGEKMSKSTGLFFRVLDVLKEYSPNVLKYFLLKSHYRSPLEYSRELVENAKSAWERIDNFINKGEIREIEIKNPETKEYIKKFEEYMDDDLNTPRVFALIFDLVKRGNLYYEKGDEKFLEIKSIVLLMLRILGFTDFERKIESKIVGDLLDIIIEIRQKLREEKRFDLSDKIRNDLKNLGIIIEDKKDKTSYKFV